VDTSSLLLPLWRRRRQSATDDSTGTADESVAQDAFREFPATLRLALPLALLLAQVRRGFAACQRDASDLTDIVGHV
jgi:hypothetical protein